MADGVSGVSDTSIDMASHSCKHMWQSKYMVIRLCALRLQTAHHSHVQVKIKRHDFNDMWFSCQSGFQHVATIDGEFYRIKLIRNHGGNNQKSQCTNIISPIWELEMECVSAFRDILHASVAYEKYNKDKNFS